jgi:hypothetical protein
MRSKEARLAALVAALMCTAPVAHAAPAAQPTSSVTLQWTAPGDDGQFGVATRYEVRYATEPITAATWKAATVVADTPHPQAAGKREKLKVKGLDSGTKYWFAVRAVDDAGNWSPLSNVPARTAPDPVFVAEAIQTTLSPPWPCPSRGPVQLAMTLANDSDVDVEVYDVGGRRLLWLAAGTYPAGTTTLRWNFLDAMGRRMPIGTYFVIARLGAQVFRHQVALIP